MKRDIANRPRNLPYRWNEVPEPDIRQHIQGEEGPKSPGGAVRASEDNKGPASGNLEPRRDKGTKETKFKP